MDASYWSREPAEGCCLCFVFLFFSLSVSVSLLVTVLHFFLVIITDYFLNLKLIYLRFLDFCQLRLYIHAKIQLI